MANICQKFRLPEGRKLKEYLIAFDDEHKNTAWDLNFFFVGTQEYASLKGDDVDIVCTANILSPPNHKLNCMSTNGLCGADCGGHICKGCYAVNGYRYSGNRFTKDIYVHVLRRWFKYEYIDRLKSELLKLPFGSTVRLNESGDYDEQWMLDMMVEICGYAYRERGIEFYMYTSMEHLNLDWMHLDKVAKINFSRIPCRINGKIYYLPNYGDEEYLDFLVEHSMIPLHKCHWGFVVDPTKCMGEGCQACKKFGTSTVFLQHGSSKEDINTVAKILKELGIEWVG